MDPNGISEKWALLGGKDKGFLTMKDYYEMFDRYMPKGFDRDLALELFSELDSDKDGKLTYKDFHDTLLFEL